MPNGTRPFALATKMSYARLKVDHLFFSIFYARWMVAHLLRNMPYAPSSDYLISIHQRIPTTYPKAGEIPLPRVGFKPYAIILRPTPWVFKKDLTLLS
jgi:hypothetical protein